MEEILYVSRNPVHVHVPLCDLTCEVSTKAAAHSLGWRGMSVVYSASPEVYRDTNTGNH